MHVGSLGEKRQKYEDWKGSVRNGCSSKGLAWLAVKSLFPTHISQIWEHACHNLTSINIFLAFKRSYLCQGHNGILGLEGI